MCYLVLWPQEGALSPGSGKANPPLVQDLNTQSTPVHTHRQLPGTHSHIHIHAPELPAHSHACSPPFASLLLCVFVMFAGLGTSWGLKIQSRCCDPCRLLFHSLADTFTGGKSLEWCSGLGVPAIVGEERGQVSLSGESLSTKSPPAPSSFGP